MEKLNGYTYYLDGLPDDWERVLVAHWRDKSSFGLESGWEIDMVYRVGSFWYDPEIQEHFRIDKKEGEANSGYYTYWKHPEVPDTRTRFE